MRSTFIASWAAIAAFTFMIGCSKEKAGDAGGSAGAAARPDAPTVGFVQAVEDVTVDEARKGFYDALREAGYSDSAGTVKIIYKNSQGDGAALNQIIDYFLSEKVDLIAANTTMAMKTAASRTQTIPIYMMVAPSPDLVGLTNPPNLFGTYENLAYIDTSIALIKQVFPNAKRVGSIFNSSEDNSVNSMNRLRARCQALGLELVDASVTSSNETQQVMQSLLDKEIDVFFALPDNIIFTSFETVYKQASDKKVPIVTSEAGLVKRGAFIAYGADFYQWGHQAGVSAAKYLKTHDPKGTPLEIVQVRKRVFNPKTAQELGLPAPAGFEALQ